MSLRNRIIYGFFGGVIALGVIALSLAYFVNSSDPINGPVAILLERRTESQQPLKFAVVDMIEIKSKSRVYLSLQKDLEEYHDKFHQEILKKEEDLRAQMEKLRSSSTSGDSKVSTEFLKSKEEFDKRVAVVEREVQSRKELLSQKFNKAYKIVDSRLDEIVSKLCRDENIGLLINKGASQKSGSIDEMVVLHSHPIFDLTRKIITMLDDEISGIDIETFDKKETEKNKEPSSATGTR